jgi:hypothetical protein
MCGRPKTRCDESFIGGDLSFAHSQNEAKMRGDVIAWDAGQVMVRERGRRETHGRFYMFNCQKGIN